MKNTGINNKEPANKGSEILERACLNWMAQIPGVGKQTAGRLLKKFGSAAKVYSASLPEWKDTVPERICNAMMKRRESSDIIRDYQNLAEKDLCITACYLNDYPERLRQIPDSPVFLYYRGRLPENSIPSVAIIGARDCSSYGRYTAQLFAEAFAEAGLQIISGLASGIDGIGQTAACRCGGKCFAVLGSGADVCYPASNRQLYEDIIHTEGGIISEYTPGTQPSPGLFPPRNRIISELSDLILVVEAKEKSGTMITVDMALEQGKEVYAIPGRITDSFQAGCHKLIRQGAGMATSPWDILEAMGIPKTSQISREVELSEKELRIWKILDTDPKSMEQIWREVRAEVQEKENGRIENIQEIMYLLVVLCSKGVAEQQGTSYRKIVF